MAQKSFTQKQRNVRESGLFTIQMFEMVAGFSAKISVNHSSHVAFIFQIVYLSATETIAIVRYWKLQSKP